MISVCYPIELKSSGLPTVSQSDPGIRAVWMQSLLGSTRINSWGNASEEVLTEVAIVLERKQ